MNLSKMNGSDSSDGKHKKSPVDRLYNKYPMRRGLVGNLANFAGMAYTRMGISLRAEGQIGRASCRERV